MIKGQRIWEDDEEVEDSELKIKVTPYIQVSLPSNVVFLLDSPFK